MDYGFQSPNLFLVHARKFPNKCFLLLVCPLCLKDNEDFYIYSFYAPIPLTVGVFFSIYNVVWAFNGSLSSNVFQLLRGPLLPNRRRLIWANMSKLCWQKSDLGAISTFFMTKQGARWTWQRRMLQPGVFFFF